MRPPATKDPRLEAKRAKAELGDLVAHAMDPSYEARLGAEAEGFWVLRLVVAEYIMGESELAGHMRRFIAALCDRRDPLRRDLRPEHWALLWPTLNTLMSARESFTLERADKEAEARVSTPLAPGPGSLGPDSGLGEAGR